MTIKEISLRRLKHHTSTALFESFTNVYKSLFYSEELSRQNRLKILSTLVLFANQSDIFLQRLSYRMALLYGNKTRDFLPLHDIAVNTGLIPVVALLKNIGELPLNSDILNRDSFLSNIVDSFIENFKRNEILLTEDQYQLNGFFEKNLDYSSTVIAPTSYGKSELIVSAAVASESRKICIIVPSKALLAQTRKRLIDAKIPWIKRIVAHPEMHTEEGTSAIYVLTQERLTKILAQDKQLSFDIVIVDEAHNLLEGDSRNTLLASVIKILQFRNPNTAFKFLTPFLTDAENLKLRGNGFQTLQYRVNEYVKSEMIYVIDFREKNKSVKLYDQFVDKFFSVCEHESDYISYLLSRSINKNIVYLNRPKHIQEFAFSLANRLPEVNSDLISEAIKEIGDNVSKNYLLLNCMRHGVLYHHGSMSDSIRSYVEHLYKNCKAIKYLITNSTLLEGMNLPAERLFLLSITKGRSNLSPPQFKNLIGRVNRFSEIFSNPTEESLLKLQPEVHIIGSNEYTSSRLKLELFCRKAIRVDAKDADSVENVLLQATPIDEKNEPAFDRAMTRLENLQRGITNDYLCPIVTTKVGLKLLENNITEIDVFRNEVKISNVLDDFASKHKPISNSNALMALIYQAFVAFINSDDTDGKDSLLRLKNEKAQTFYAMFLDWRVEHASLPVTIQRMIRYWEGLPENTMVFVGGWGDITKENEHRPLYTIPSSKTLNEKINLAIVRIKEEMDFFDHVVFRFIEILNDLNMMDEGFYKSAKYGTTDNRVILLIRNGLSKGVAELLLRSYAPYVKFEGADEVVISTEIHRRLREDSIGFLQRQELTFIVSEV